jgi:translation initiation factor 2D
VSPIVGKSSGMEVLVQGRHGKAVMDLLVSKGVPKKWVEVVDMGDKK